VLPDAMLSASAAPTWADGDNIASIMAHDAVGSMVQCSGYRIDREGAEFSYSNL